MDRDRQVNGSKQDVEASPRPGWGEGRHVRLYNNRAIRLQVIPVGVATFRSLQRSRSAMHDDASSALRYITLYATTMNTMQASSQLSRVCKASTSALRSSTRLVVSRRGIASLTQASRSTLPATPLATRQSQWRSFTCSSRCLAEEVKGGMPFESSTPYSHLRTSARHRLRKESHAYVFRLFYTARVANIQML